MKWHDSVRDLITMMKKGVCFFLKANVTEEGRVTNYSEK